VSQAGWRMENTAMRLIHIARDYRRVELCASQPRRGNELSPMFPMF